MLGIVLIFTTLILLIFLAYRGVSLLLAAPALAAVAAFLNGAPVLASYTQVFMEAMGRFVVAYFPLFLMGALFGRLMGESGAARTIGHRTVSALGQRNAILAIIVCCAVLTYGGVSLFVVAFAVFPIAKALFEAADIPARLIPGTIALGAFTFTMTALPGTPAIQNAIPMPYFGTTAFAAPWLGLTAAAVMALVGYGWLKYRERQARQAGEGFGGCHGADEQAATDSTPRPTDPTLSKALLPIVLVLALNLVLSIWLLPAFDYSFLREPEWGGIEPASVIGVWAIIVSLVVACLSVLATNPRLFRTLLDAMSPGAQDALMPMFNTASLVGFGAVIAALPAFGVLKEMILAISPGNPLISLSVSINILAGITGSASGGMSIALEALGERYLALGNAAGIDPAVLHRVTAVATGGLDALPHNGAVVTLLAICGMTHAKSYLDVLVVAVIGPVLSLAVIVGIASL
ncbi:GntP family permease [Larsenimonas suaedae]|uniref:GntP family permease n=1 Tax=Larsenimonas suaedae TaxID=1851019 RepID=A0ABU1GW93_9GAMM|nr:GntP family permease [Larsenimonas suaedae]MCM2973428.1 GntP family permease [Larsenimonas suaedae]MDR5896321.1 GntP family permease [Larsenimonas suaedae]